MVKPATVFITLLIGTFVLSASVQSSTDLHISARKPAPEYVRPDRIGKCRAHFVKNNIEPVIKCWCRVIHKGAISTNVQNLAERNCRSYFGSVGDILAIKSPCVKFTKSGGSLNKKKLQSKMQEIRDRCFPDAGITVIIH